MREVHVSFTHTKSLLYGPLSSSLVCAVSYTTQYGEKLYFRKFFKFQVSYIEESSLEVECRLGKDLRNVTDSQQSRSASTIPAWWSVAVLHPRLCCSISL